MKLDDRSIILTGASSGIGKALAHILMARGAHLTLVARREDRLACLVADLCRRYPHRPSPQICTGDLRKPHARERALQCALNSFGALDALINNAGISAYGSVTRSSSDNLRDLMDLNYYAAAEMSLAGIPHLLNSRGTIVNVLSLAALHGVPFLAGYGASKAALANFSQSLRAELAPYGVRVLLVYPNYTDTELFDKETRLGGARRPQVERTSPQDVAKSIVRAMKHGSEDLVLTTQGRLMQWARALTPGLLNRGMRNIAQTLRTEEVHHV